MSEQLPAAQEVLIADLKPAEYNPRQMSEFDFGQLVDSIKQNGFIEPITINTDNTIISGHMRTKAAKEAGLTRVTAIVVDVDKDEEKALNMKMNRTRGTFDSQKVAELLYGIRGKTGRGEKDLLDLTGFTLREQSSYLDMVSAGADDRLDEQRLVDEVMAGEYVPDARLGDVYVMGKHRLACGDALAADDVSALMGEERADMVWTRPSAPTEDRQDFLNSMLELAANLYGATKAGATFYLASQWPGFSAVEEAAHASGLHVESVICLVRDRAKNGSDYSSKQDPVLKAKKGGKKAEAVVYGFKGDAQRYSRESSDMDFDVWDMDQRGKKGLIGEGDSPDWPVMRAIKNSTRVKEVVLDVFSGTGSSLMACEKTGRDFRGMELDPRLVDVTVRRWEAYTNQKAELHRAAEDAVAAEAGEVK